ncbi:MAG: PH domain-containing protein [Myxococcota bacterium]|nr:PH domain-containing protein [Myxococcota bacterium]
MPSDGRLHPSAILFIAARHLRSLAIPIAFGAIGAGRGSSTGVYVLGALLAGIVVFAVLHYATFRYRLAGAELVLRSGVLFRRERHIPFDRIQNLDAQHTPVHRMLGVVEARIQTGGGDELEAKLAAITRADYDAMRSRIQQRSPIEPPATSPVLVALSLADIALVGLAELRGVAVLVAALGLVWEVGGERLLRARDIAGWVLGIDLPAPARIALGIAGLVVVIALLSALWAIVRLHRFRAWREADAIRVEHGLITRLAATIPFRRIQSVTITDGPVHRLAGRVTVEAETAGGSGGDAGTDRARLAPMLPATQLPALLAEVVPELSLELAWQPLAPRAWRRVLVRSLILAALIAATSVFVIGWWAFAAFAALAVLAVGHARAYARHTRWAIADTVFVFRRGWLWRRMTIVRRAKIQVTELAETPFDRRHAMARVGVDTASASLAIPYLALASARELHDTLAAGAAHTTFRW